MIMSGKKPYFPNNWREWKEVPDEFLYAPTYEEFNDWKLHGWQLPSSVFCIIRETKPSGKIKEYTYQRPASAEKKVRQLMLKGTEFIVCTEDALQFNPPKNTNEPDYD